MVFSGGMGFINNPAILFVTGWVNVYAIFLFRQSFVSIGNELAESGEMDGANFVLIIVKLYLPLGMPIVAVLSLNCFLGTWNDYMTPYLYLPSHQTLATGIYTLSERLTTGNDKYSNDYPKLFASMLLSILPVLVIFAAFQDKIMKFQLGGGIKG